MFCKQHQENIGTACFDGDVFTMKCDFEQCESLKELIAKGWGISHCGQFDNRGVLILHEVSIVRCPRFKMEIVEQPHIE